ncbi:MAG TPA: Ig-like domain-containing protein, partial [Pyrinomonadaceae bacterium]|nr:Ig-like domain-containing protein [Pyrinomonadaceae bacterium]
MPRIHTLARVIRSLSFRKNSKSNNSTKSNRSSAPMLIAAVALLAAVAFSVSVESRRGRWLGTPRPATPAANPEVAKDSSARSDALKTSTSRSTSPTFVAPFAPTVTATKADSFVDGDGDLKAEPGDTLKYTVVIGATGEDATGVTFSDTVDTNTTFVPGSLMTTPLARNDSFSASGNIRITVAAPGVLANDQDFDGVGPALNVTAGTFLSAQGGNVTLNADGSFTYNPAPGFEGSDSFTYTLNDGEGPGDTGTVSITVTGMIWFINN